MHIALAAIMLLVVVAASSAEALFEEVHFIQYLDENTAIEEVRRGNIDMYYWRIPSERLSTPESREGLDIYESTSNSYSILTNPAVTEQFNPFSIRDIRFALNYLLDRNLIVNELMGGYGAAMVSFYGPYDPEYISIIQELESYNFRYNPALAYNTIHDSMTESGGILDEGTWMVDDMPVELTFMIRSDDPVRKSIGEVLAQELEQVGFVVHRDYGDLNKAFVTVYGSNPADLQWHLYTEGWGRSGFVRYDSVGLAQMYAPWFSNMPGFNDPSSWNYENPQIDALTQAIYTGNFTSSTERTGLIREAVGIGIDEGVRIYLAGRTDQYVVNDSIQGVINDFGAGIPSRFTTINARSDADTLKVGVKQVYQGSWNPVGGLTDLYSNHIWYAVWDPVLFRHPYSGEVIPVRAQWDTHTAGPGGVLPVPSDAIVWDVTSQSWQEVGADINATSMVRFQYTFGNWHHGIPMNMNDILYSLYFSTEWGTDSGEGDRTVDPHYTPRASQSIGTIKGVRVINDTAIDVYVDYWHFDEGEIASWASLGASMPWEIYSAMESAVLDGKTAFSRTVATSHEISWLSVIVPNDADILRSYLAEFAQDGRSPAALSGVDAVPRYEAAISWIDERGHAAISNGPYSVRGYSPESRTIMVERFDDPSYPFGEDRWAIFEAVQTPHILGADIPDTVPPNGTLEVFLETADATSVRYFVTDSTGSVVVSGEQPAQSSGNTINVDASSLAGGAAIFKAFALSDTVLRPDSHSAAFLVSASELPALDDTAEVAPRGTDMSWVAIPVIVISLGLIAYVARRRAVRTRMPP